MVEKKRRGPYRKWTDEALKTEAAKYKTRGDFLKGSPSAYMTAKRLGLFEDITKHMFTGRFTWTEAMVKSEAKKYKTRTEFFKGARSAYSAAVRMDILDKVTEHMPSYAGKGKKRGPNIRTLSKAAANG
jgi:hypothetical protein